MLLVETGTEYENLVISSFEQQGFRLQRCGGGGDRGIDFFGSLPLTKTNSTQTFEGLRIVGQCKRKQKPIQPQHLREWEGAMNLVESNTNNQQTLWTNNEETKWPMCGILVCCFGFTPLTLRHFSQLTRPTALVHLDLRGYIVSV
jgi:hypothetical protein